jgi:hypothetical protein
MITLIGECMNCGKIYGNRVAGTLESIYNLEVTHKCEGEEEGECDKCATSYDLSSRDNRCGDCGNCDTCCTHEREGK